jgi:hypothetical protein
MITRLRARELVAIMERGRQERRPYLLPSEFNQIMAIVKHYTTFVPCHDGYCPTCGAKGTGTGEDA